MTLKEKLFILANSNPEGINQWTKGGATSGHEAGDRVRINPRYVNSGKPSHGIIDPNELGGNGFHAVTDKKGKHNGYFHESDLASIDRKEGK